MANQGFTTWRPNAESLQIFEMIQQVLDDYKDYLPLTGRQIFYRMVGAYGYEKSETAANRVYNVLGRARRCGWISFSAVRDGGGKSVVPLTYPDADGFWDEVRRRRRHFNRHRQAGQDVFIELFCESPGMMPQLQTVAFRYSVPVYGTRGFTSLGVTGDIVKRALEREAKTVVLQVGDYDPSGVSIFESMTDDVEMFVHQVTYAATRQDDPAAAVELGGLLGIEEETIMDIVTGRSSPGFEAHRIAITWDQVEEHDLPTAPPSSKDSRSKNWVGETAQAEALPPDLLAEIVTDAIEGKLDMDRYHEEVEAETADEESIDEVLDGV